LIRFKNKNKRNRYLYVFKEYLFTGKRVGFKSTLASNPFGNPKRIRRDEAHHTDINYK
jgi:hypothetical protein